MRTAEETINRIVLTGFDLPDAINLIKDYAKQVAEQALKDAQYHAEIEHWTGKDYNDSEFRVRSFLNTEIKTP